MANFTNLTLPNVTTGMGPFIRYANESTDYAMGFIFLIGIFLVIFLTQKGSFKQNVASGTFVSAFAAIIFWIMGIVTEYVALVFILVAALTLAILAAM